MLSARVARRIAFALVFCSSAVLAQAPVAKPIRVRGDIVSVSPDSIVVRRAGAEDVTVELKSNLVVSTVVNVRLEDIKAGTFVGSTAIPGTDGKLVAKEVHVFPESARGSGEGHYEWDVGGSGSTMTNANIDLIVDGTSGRDLKLSYKGGTKLITVPVGTPIVTGAEAARSDLVVGKKVFLAASRDESGRLATQRIVVEKNGVAPPF